MTRPFRVLQFAACTTGSKITGYKPMIEPVFQQTHTTAISTEEFGRLFMESDSLKQCMILRSMKAVSKEWCWDMQCRWIADGFNGDEAEPIADFLQVLIDCLRDRKNGPRNDAVRQVEYSVSFDCDGEVCAHKVKAGGPAEASDIVQRRFDSPLKIHSVVLLEE